MSLADLAESVGGLGSLELQGRLARPWFWPVDQAEAARLAAAGFKAPAPPAPGQAILVSISSTAERRTLWALAHGLKGGRRTPLGSAAEAARLLAEQLVLRDLPLMRSHRSLFPPGAWSACAVHTEGHGGDAALDGASIGASFLLAAASVALETPVPSWCAASAALSANGLLAPVGRIEEKAALVERYALGVHTFFVHSTQEAQAKRGLREGRLRVVGVKSSQELVKKAFEGFDAPAQVARSWSDLARARSAADHLFGLALGHGGSLLAWEPLRQLAGRLLERLGEDPLAPRAAFAERVFARHCDLHAPLDPLPDAAGLPEPIRLLMLAHVVQAAADCFEQIDERIALGRAELPESVRACHADHLKLRGAIGRALAHRRRYEEAASWLEETVAAWLAVRLPSQASFALCELARVSGILGDRRRLEGVEASGASMAAAPETTHDFIAYLDLALGRAWTLCGLPERGLGRLDSPSLVEAVVMDPVQATRRRWRAQALEALGRTDEAAAERGAFEAAERASWDEVDHALVALERATTEGSDPEPALAYVRRLRPAMVRSLGEGLQGRELALRLLREYPY